MVLLDPEGNMCQAMMQEIVIEMKMKILKIIREFKYTQVSHYVQQSDLGNYQMTNFKKLCVVLSVNKRNSLFTLLIGVLV